MVTFQPRQTRLLHGDRGFRRRLRFLRHSARQTGSGFLRPWYNTNGYAPTFPVVTVTSVPATLPVQIHPTIQAITMPATPYYLPSTMPTAFPTQVPVTVPPTPYYIPSTSLRIPNPFAHGRCGTWPEYRDIPVRTEPSGEVREDYKFGNNSGGHDRVEDNEQPGKCPYLYRLPPWRWNNLHLRAQPVFNPDRLLRKGRDGFAQWLYYPYGADFWNPAGDTASLYNSQGQLVGRITA